MWARYSSKLTSKSGREIRLSEISLFVPIFTPLGLLYLELSCSLFICRDLLADIATLVGQKCTVGPVQGLRGNSFASCCDPQREARNCVCLKIGGTEQYRFRQDLRPQLQLRLI